MTVRPLTADDLSSLVEVHRAAFGAAGRPAEVIETFYRSTFRRLFEPAPPGAPTVPSLVYEHKGRVVGLLGVAVRLFRFDGEPVWAAVTSQLSVDPSCSNALAGVQLARAAFAGPQDLTFADRSNPLGRQTLRGAGGQPVPAMSLRFARVLRPAGAIAAAVRRRRPGPLGGAVAATVPRLDAVVPAPVRRRLALPEAPRELRGADVTAAEVAERAAALLVDVRLRPWLEDPALVRWRWDRLDVAQPSGDRERIGLRNRKGTLVGWYVLHQPRPEVVELIELVAQPAHRSAVLIHAFNRAFDRGAASIHGDVSPQLQMELADLGAVFHGSNANFTIHSDRGDILEAVRRNELFTSGLDGEYLLDLAAGTGEVR